MIYLDHAATTPVPRPVADAMYQVLTEQFGNPSSQYPLGREAKALVEDGRAVSSTGNTQPVSLFTSIMLTSTVSSRRAWATCSAVT